MPRQRRTWQKSTNGCNRCKSSHVKCDEHRPCQRCLRLGRECSYEQQVAIPFKRKQDGLRFQFDLIELPSRFALPTFSGSEKELTAFQFFLEETVPILDQQFSMHTWVELLLAVQSSNTAVHQACLAVGSLHRSLTGSQHDGSDRGRTEPPVEYCRLVARDSLRLYIQALRKARQGLENGSIDPIATKLTSILLALYSSLQHREDELVAHLFGGLQLTDSSKLSTRPDLAQSADGVLSSHRFLSLMLKGAVEPDNVPAMSDELSTADSRVPSDVRDARASLHVQLGASIMFGYQKQRGTFRTPLEQETRRIQIRAALDVWKASIKDLEARKSREDQAGLALLIAQYEFARSRLDVNPGPDGPVAGPSAASLEAIVASIERFLNLYMQSAHVSRRVFSFQTGVIPLLLYTAQKSQDIRLQERILELMHRVPVTEGAWNTTAAIKSLHKLSLGQPIDGLTLLG